MNRHFFSFSPSIQKNNANQYFKTRYSALGQSKIKDSTAIPENDSVQRLFLMFESSQYELILAFSCIVRKGAVTINLFACTKFWQIIKRISN